MAGDAQRVLDRAARQPGQAGQRIAARGPEGVQHGHAVANPERTFVTQHPVAAHPIAGRRHGEPGRIPGVFGGLVAQALRNRVEPGGLAGAQPVDHGLVEQRTRWVEAGRTLRPQGMAHIAARNHGDAAAPRAGHRLAEGPAHGDATLVAGIVQRHRQRGPGPTGLGQEPQRHHRSVVEFLVVVDPPGRDPRGPRLRPHRRRQSIRHRQVDPGRRGAEPDQRPAQPSPPPQAERPRAPRGMRADHHHGHRPGRDRRLRHLAHRVDGCLHLAASRTAHRGHEDGRVREQGAEAHATGAVGFGCLPVHGWFLPRDPTPFARHGEPESTGKPR